EGYYLLFLLAVGLLARATLGPVERFLNMLGEQRICAAVYAFAFAVNLVLCIVLIPYLGVTGAASSTSIALVGESIFGVPGDQTGGRVPCLRIRPFKRALNVHAPGSAVSRTEWRSLLQLGSI